MLFFWFLVICKYSLSVFNFVFQKCWYHGCIHAPSGCQMSIDFFAFGGCENWAWSTHSKWNFFFYLCKMNSVKNLCIMKMSSHWAIVKSRTQIFSEQFSSTSNDEEKWNWIFFNFQFVYKRFISLFLLSVARMVDCTTGCTCVFMTLLLIWSDSPMETV